MSNGIKISPKHGVNATISVCIFCGKDKNELAMLGKIVKRDKNGKIVDRDYEAPQRMVLNYNPCDECIEKFSQGVTLIGVTKESPDGRPPVKSSDGTDVYITGANVVLTEEDANEMFKFSTKKGDRLFIEQSVLEQIFGGDKNE